jgi:hypothetical protein
VTDASHLDNLGQPKQVYLYQKINSAYELTSPEADI